MKRMKYQVQGTVYRYDEAADATLQEVIACEVDAAWSEAAEGKAQAVAVDGVTVYDDGEPEKESAGTDDAQIWTEMAAAIREGVNGVE